MDLVSQLNCHAKHAVRNTPSALELGSPDADDLGAGLGAWALAGSLCSEHPAPSQCQPNIRQGESVRDTRAAWSLETLDARSSPVP
eukprot:COSAG04_NODE_4686_length_1948_cov_13.827064_2_plen_86_part_00